MKILVGITCYGTRNLAHVRTLIDAYRSMPFDVDIVVLSEAPKALPAGVQVRVGLPTPDPWSLGFAHRQLFADKAGDYDLFIYSEDDILVSEANIRAFLRAVQLLPPEVLPGFLRFELHPDGQKNYPDIHGPYHWEAASVRRAGEYVLARLSNEHSGCYLLTREQLARAIASGGFLVAPHRGRYDLLCSAATDPYTQCGFERVMCLSHLNDFELRHLSDAYVHRNGLVDADGAVVDGRSQQLMCGALLEVLRSQRPAGQLFRTKTALPTSLWDKSYHEPLRDDLLRLLPPGARRVLCVGCGSGATEAALVQRGVQVTAIPLDAVVARLLQDQGVYTVEPDFGRAFGALQRQQFDAIVLSEVLQHLPEPVGLLRRLKGLLEPSGVLIGSVPNLCAARRCAGRLLAKNKQRFRGMGDFSGTQMNLSSLSGTRRWLKAGGLAVLGMGYSAGPAPCAPRGRWSGLLPGAASAAHVLFVAR